MDFFVFTIVEPEDVIFARDNVDQIIEHSLRFRSTSFLESVDPSINLDANTNTILGNYMQIN